MFCVIPVYLLQSDQFYLATQVTLPWGYMDTTVTTYEMMQSFFEFYIKIFWIFWGIQIKYVDFGWNCWWYSFYVDPGYILGVIVTNGISWGGRGGVGYNIIIFLSLHLLELVHDKFFEILFKFNTKTFCFLLFPERLKTRLFSPSGDWLDKWESDSTSDVTATPSTFAISTFAPICTSATPIFATLVSIS